LVEGAKRRQVAGVVTEIACGADGAAHLAMTVPLSARGPAGEVPPTCGRPLPPVRSLRPPPGPRRSPGARAPGRPHPG
jgi:hypothetical protein